VFSAVNKTLPKAVLNQFVYKLKANSGYFCGLIFVQIFATWLSIGGASEVASFSFTLHTLSGLIIIILSVAWAIFAGAAITSQNHRKVAFTVAGNRLTNNLSDIVFIFFGCLFGGITTSLLSVALRVPIYFSQLGKVYINGFYVTFADFLRVALVGMLCMLFAASFGYFCGKLALLNPIFIILIPAIAAFLYVNMINMAQTQKVYMKVWIFFIREKSLCIFSIKCIVAAAVLFAIGDLITNRLEVRK
jgi:hypothetical protein